MSTQVLPSLPGLTWPLKRTPMWKARKPEAISGKETSISDYSFPRYQWEASWALLKQGAVLWNPAQSDQATLLGFFNARNGGADSFLYTDPNDSVATTQQFGVGDGTTTTFQLARTLGGFTEPITAPNVVTTIFDNGTPVSGGNYSVAFWGTSTPGIVTFVTAPIVGHILTWTGTYYFPCRFVEDSCEFVQFDAGRFEVQKLTFKSIK